MIYDPVLFVVGLVAFAAGLLQIRYYWLIRSINYLLLSGVLFALCLNVMAIALFEAGLVSTTLVIISITLLFTSLTYLLQNTPTSAFTFGHDFLVVYLFLYALNSLIFTIFFYDNEIIVLIHYVRILAEEVLQMIIGRRLFFIYRELSIKLINRRTVRIKRIWMAFGVTLFIMAFIRAPVYLGLSITYFISSEGYILFQSLLPMTYTVVDIGTGVIGVLLFTLAVFYPESMLLSEEQILQVSKIHRRLKLLGEDPPSFINETYLLDYLNEVTPMLDNVEEDPPDE